jgi:NAD(P)-dependent dehydrogenase (short-subunit alcohol dehydrogenase family)
MSRKLEGKVAVVTGGNSGLGFAAARRFIEEGATVFITGRRQAELDAAVKDLGPHAIGVQGDVARPADLDRLYAVVKEKAGHVDVLFANAGTAEITPLEQVDEAHFDRIFNTNVKGLLFTVQKALPLFRDGGSIVLNSSIVNAMGVAAFSVYAASKAAVRSFARSWATDLKSRKIRVNSLSPGTVVTPGYKNSLKLNDQQIEKMAADTQDNVPLGRPGTPEEIANVALFLASDESSYVNGVDLAADGGWSQV